MFYRRALYKPAMIAVTSSSIPRQKHGPPVAPSDRAERSTDQQEGMRDDLSPTYRLPEVDLELTRALARLSNSSPEYWDFTHGASPRDVHAYYRYPAMMVPSMQREILRLIKHLQPSISSILEPFAGSGTVMLEGMLLGISVYAQDVNPLAVLLCRAKAGPFFIRKLADIVEEVIQLSQTSKDRRINVSFQGIDKWFTEVAQVELSRIRKAILRVHQIWARRFLWVALAETARLTSNSRTSTYKLHIRPIEEINKLPSALTVFADVARKNLTRLCEFHEQLTGRNLLDRGRLRTPPTITLIDSKITIHKRSYDLLVTSPPYGDNQTTVPYGQNAFLPLQWVQLSDIDSSLEHENILKSTHEIDNRCLGGVLPHSVEFSKYYSGLLEQSETLRNLYDLLKKQPRDRLSRVLCFIRDLEHALKTSLLALSENAYAFITVGNRRVGGYEIPLDNIIRDLTFHQGMEYVSVISRNIPSKRMAVRNKTTSTMRREKVLILRRINHRGSR